MRINLLLKFTAFVREPCRHFYFWTLARRTYGAFLESENRIKKKPRHPYAVATLIIAIIATPPPFTPPFFNPPSYSSRNARTCINVNDSRCATTGEKNHDRWRFSIL